MKQSSAAARDGVEFRFRSGGEDWIASWHSPAQSPPGGTPHGSAAICFTLDREVVLVSSDGATWEVPGGRPEVHEDFRATLDREISEEACARIERASLLGFSKGTCMSGPGEGLVLVRSLWCAVVSLREWAPRHEMNYRRLVPSCVAIEQLDSPVGLRSIYRRWFGEALGIFPALSR